MGGSVKGEKMAAEKRREERVKEKREGIERKDAHIFTHTYKHINI